MLTQLHMYVCHTCPCVQVRLVDDDEVEPDRRVMAVSAGGWLALAGSCCAARSP